MAEKEKQKCKATGCNKPVLAKGYCKNHYYSYHLYGDPNALTVPMHGLSQSPEYEVWESMKTRCNNKKCKSYIHYGGRGIKVCARWENNFINFYNDMGRRPDPKYEIDRIDNDGDYCPENCRWVTRTQNARNKSSNKLNVDKVNEIRKLYSTGLRSGIIAKMFDVSKTMVKMIINDKSWRKEND